jgi:hypothetical protein
MKKKLLGLLALLVLLGSILTPVLAQQSYRFQVTREVVNLYANKDGTATIEYYYDFKSDPGYIIDYVDVGVPNSNYDLSSVTAEINGVKVTDISQSTYVTPGITFGLGANTIQGGQSGQLHALIRTVSNMFYQADASQTKKSEPYSSFQFSPNWFDSSAAYGNTDITVNIFLPPGILETEPVYFPPKDWPGEATPTSGYSTNGLAFYSWRSTSADSYTQYIFGGAFPARLIPAGAIQSPPATPLIQISWDQLFGYGFCGCFALIIGASIYGATIGAKKRKLAYLPPKIAVEGMGIKRGLTAVEAAILMEQPMDKILTMILFSSIKKGAATVVTKDPMTLKVAEPLPDGLQTYEVDFLKAFQLQDLAGARRRALQDMMIALVKTVTEKMKGFSLKDTLAYYNDITKKAWDQVEAAQTPDVKMQAFDDQMDWTMLDHNFDSRTRNVFSGGPVFIPLWWGGFDPAYRSSGASIPGTGSVMPSGGISIPRPNVPGSAFAQSLVNGIQGFAGHAVGDLTTFTSGVTNLTNPVPVSTSSGSHIGGSGGGHCACACACAGCACACAGGGR